MSEEQNGPNDIEAETTAGDGIKTEPPGNPEPDPDALEKGQETLERVKPY